MNKNFYSIVAHISEKPGVYGINKVEDIAFLIRGMWLIAEGHQIDIVSKFTREFRNFVNHEYSDYFRKGDYDWERLIRLYAFSDKNTLERFSELFNSYLAFLNNNSIK